MLRREDRKQRCKVWGNTNRHDREVCTPVANWSRVSVCQVEIPYPHQNRAAVESQCSGCVCESAVSLFVSAIRSLPANSHASLGAAKSTLEFMVGWGDRSSVSTVHTPRHAASAAHPALVAGRLGSHTAVPSAWNSTLGHKTNAKTRAFQLQRKPPRVWHTHTHTSPPSVHPPHK